jgi:hypothetical protein
MNRTVDQIENIRTREDLIVFLQELHQDHRDNPQAWDNNTLELFLEALAAWAQDMDGFYLNQKLPVPEKPEWKTFAHMLVAATMYE